MKKNSPKNILSKEQKTKIQSFWAPYTKVNTLSHNFYTDKTKTFDEKIIPNEVFDCKIEPYFNPHRIGEVLDNKCLYAQLFSGFLQPKTVVKRMGTIWLDADMNVIDRAKAIKVILEKQAVFIKAACESMGGEGVAYIDCLKENAAKSIDSAIKKIKGDIIVQLPVKQHEKMSAINSSSVNTIRVLTLLENSGVSKISTVVRMGAGGSKVDNAGQGGISCGVKDNGKLKKFAYTKPGERIEMHPDSNLVFEDYEIPSYEEAVEFCKKAHLRVPQFRLVSWDIAINESAEPLMIEANLYRGGLTIHQLNNGGVFGERTEDVLKEVFLKK